MGFEPRTFFKLVAFAVEFLPANGNKKCSLLYYSHMYTSIPLSHSNPHLAEESKTSYLSSID